MITIMLLSFSLSIDALGIGASYGIRKIKLSNSAKFIISLQSIIITSIAIYLGGIMGNILNPQISKLIGATILIFLGTWVIYQGVKEDKPRPERKNSVIYNIIIKPLGITIKIIRTPETCDIDNSNYIDPKEAIYLGFALSIDSFGAGLGSGIAGISSPLIPFMVAFCQIAFLSLGKFIALNIKTKCSVKDNLWTFFSGALLILIGLLRII